MEFLTNLNFVSSQLAVPGRMHRSSQEGCDQLHCREFCWEKRCSDARNASMSAKQNRWKGEPQSGNKELKHHLYKKHVMVRNGYIYF